MSYSIFYRAMHVKTSRGILPMIEQGDNNVYECGNKRRARSWCNLHANGKVLFKDWADINAAIETWNARYHTMQDEYRNSDEEWKRESADSAFGYFDGPAVYGKSTFNTTFNDVRNLIKSGIKYMLTIDEAIDSKRLYINGGWKDGKMQPNILIENEDMLFEALDNNKWIILQHADALYDKQKAMVQMANPRKGRPVYKVYLKGDDNKVRYVSMNGDKTKFILVDTEGEAMGFTCKGVNKWWFFRQFFECKELGFYYVSA